MCGSDLFLELPAAEAEKVHFGARLAGVAMVVNGLLVLASVFVDSRGSGPVNPAGAAAVDLMIGCYLAAGSKKFLKWAIVRVVLGFVIFSAISGAQGDWFALAAQIVVSAGFLLLLLGNPARPRIAIASILFGVYFVLAGVGFQQITTGRNALTEFIARKNYELYPLDDARVSGTAFSYSIGPMEHGWCQRATEDAHRDNPLSDIWLVNPEYDAHVMVIAEENDPESHVDLKTFSDIVVSNFKKGLEDFTVTARRAAKINGTDCEILDCTGKASGIRLRYKVGCFAHKNRALQVICFSTTSAFPRMEEDFRVAIESVAVIGDS